MAFKTIDDAITQVARNMSLVNGQGMTPYSDDAVIAYLAQAHDMIAKKSEWDEMVIWRTRALDGVSGRITTLIPNTDADDWKSIIRIYHDATQTPLARLSSYANPLTSTLLYGYKGMAPEEDNPGAATGKYLVTFYPLTLAGNVLFQIARTIDFTSRDTILPIDWWWHVNLASWLFACDDGTNPTQISKFERLMQDSEDTIMALENSRPSNAQPNQMIPGDWWVDDAPYS